MLVIIWIWSRLRMVVQGVIPYWKLCRITYLTGLKPEHKIYRVLQDWELLRNICWNRE